MLYINKLTKDAQQNTILTGIPNTTINMTLRYMPRVERWIMGVTWKDFSVQGIAIVTSLNLLQQWANVIPFGICCIRSDGLDPYQIDNFLNKVANLYLLDSTDLSTINTDWFS